MDTWNRAGSCWRYFPWLLGLFLAPFLFGSVEPDGQAVVGLLFALSLFLVSNQPAAGDAPGSRWGWLAIVLLALSLVPLPAAVVGLLSPQRLALDQAFPLELNAPASWLTLTISPAGSVQRLWELSLLVTSFALARRAALAPAFPRQLAWVVGLSIGLLAAADVWYRWDGQRSILGWWHISWGKGAGTFANRNHFANWMYVALLFSFGWLVRKASPLQSARRQPLTHRSTAMAGLVLGGLWLAFGLAMAVACGSRGGFLAFLAGAVVWGGLLSRRSRRRRRWLVLTLGILLVMGLVWLAGGNLFYRFTEMQQETPVRFVKLDIWRQAWQQLFQRFPCWGTGWGTFVQALNHFKTGAGESTIWHAENDYLQLLVETGWIGFAVFGGLVLRLVRAAFRCAWRERLAEPELFFGALAALAAFAAHAWVEFVFQITAPALLAATMLGLLTGCCDQAGQPALLPPVPRWRLGLNLLGALGLFIAASAQGVACFHAYQAAHAKSVDLKVFAWSQSVRWWPWSSERQLEFTRARVAQLGAAPRGQWSAAATAVRDGLVPALARDPYHWELRLERAAIDLLFLTNRVRAVAEVYEVGRLNPLQPQIPLEFARLMVERDPDLAWEFLRSADLSGIQHLRTGLELAWRIRGDTQSLRLLVPDTVAGGLALGEFALGKGFFPLAAQSFFRLTNRVDGLELGARLLEAQRPDLAIQVMPSAPATRAAKLAVARAYFEAKAYTRSIYHAESVWLNPPVPGVAQPAANRASPELQRAEAMFRRPAAERDLPQLRRWAEAYPAELRLLWLVFQTEVERDQFAAAARTALELAGRVTAQK